MLITLDELKAQVNSMFLSSQLEEAGWGELSDDDINTVLYRANAEFNKLQWIGRKADKNQADAFPRVIYDEVVNIPDVVKMGLAEYCVNYVRLMTDSTVQELRKGLTSQKIGPISESYNLDQAMKETYTYNKYLSGWIFRGARRCC